MPPMCTWPHYDVITRADEVQIYEPIMGDNEGHVTYTLLRGVEFRTSRHSSPGPMLSKSDQKARAICRRCQQATPLRKDPTGPCWAQA